VAKQHLIHLTHELGGVDQVDFALNDIIEVAKSVLSDPNAVSDETELLLHRAPLGEGGSISEINQGAWYHRTSVVKCGDDPLKSLLPIYFFIDQTHCDNKGNVKLTPILVAFGVFPKSMLRGHHISLWQRPYSL